MKTSLLGLVFFISIQSTAQVRFSVGTDAAVMYNFSPDQKFFSFGQTVEFNFHFNQKESFYSWISFFTPASFKNNYTATAKLTGVVPPSIDYEVKGRWRTNEFSIGWKHYFRGNFDSERFWNFYGLAGFGLVWIDIDNSFNPAIDTSVYDIQPAPLPGNSDIKRLTVDLGLGIERTFGGSNVYFFGDLRTWLPTTSYPSAYLHNNKNVPLPIIASVGIRVLFTYNNDY